MTRKILYWGIGAAACAGLLGCGGGQKRRSTVEFHCKAVRTCIGLVEHQLAARQQFPMRGATDHLGRALHGLPEIIKKKASTRLEERLKTADQAIELFEHLRPTLDELKYDQAQVKAKLDELSGMIDRIEKS
jgi:hypothetical protein